MLVILAAALAFAGVAFVAARYAGDNHPRPVVGRGDPDNLLPGTLNAEAVRQAQAYDLMPVLWLGKEFAGYRLTGFEVNQLFIPGEMLKREEDLTGTSVSLRYGDCVPRGQEPSCVLPLVLLVTTPGWVPPPEAIPGDAESDRIYNVRGAKARDVSNGTTLWLPSGITVTIYSDSDMRNEALEALRLANAAALGIPEVPPGASLASLPPPKQ
jgi:hypothetical protein